MIKTIIKMILAIKDLYSINSNKQNINNKLTLS